MKALAVNSAGERPRSNEASATPATTTTTTTSSTPARGFEAVTVFLTAVVIATVHIRQKRK